MRAAVGSGGLRLAVWRAVSMGRADIGRAELPSYLTYREDVLVFDVGTFLREAGLRDTPQTRRDVETIAARLVVRLYPEARRLRVE